MHSVRQFRYNNDNLAYLIYGRQEAIAVDGGAVDDMLDFLKARGLKLTLVTNTHGHPDHVCGDTALTHRTHAPLLTATAAARKGELVLEGLPIAVIPSPGHTEDSVVFRGDGWVLTGDTLFNGTVGNCFSGDLAAFLDTMKKLMALPQNTVVYAGHDYMQDAMAFVRHVDPENPRIAAFLAAYDPDHVRSLLSDELHVNPYLRFNDPAFVEILRQRNLPVETEWQRWRATMALS